MVIVTSGLTPGSPWPTLPAPLLKSMKYLPFSENEATVELPIKSKQAAQQKNQFPWSAII